MRAPLVVGAIWMVVGLAAGLQRPVPVGGGPLLIVLALAGAAAALAGRRGWSEGGGWGGRRAIWGLYLCAGIVLGSSARAGADRSCARWIPADLPVQVHGVVLRGSPGTGGALRLRLLADSVRIGTAVAACGAELPARWSGSSSAPPGTAVVGMGRWWSPPGSTGKLVRPGALLLDSLMVDSGRPAKARVSGSAERLRQRITERVDSIFPRHPALVASLLLARRDRLDPEVRDRYARAGLSHLLAISGLHVGLVAGILLLIAGVLGAGRGRAAGMAALGTVGYVLLLGAPDSAARAALQIVLVLLARTLQRPARTASTVAAAALVLLALDPAAITRAGFQLSFAGVVGILALRRPVLTGLHRLGSWGAAGVPGGELPVGRRAGRWLADGLATSIAATLATAPIVAWHFGRVAPVGIIANVVAIPLLGAAAPALAVALCIGWVWVPAGRFVAGGAELLLDGLDRTATLAASVPMGTVAVRPLAGLTMAVAVATGYLLSRRIGPVRGPVRAAVWAAVAAAVLAAAPLRPARDRVEVHVIDVGQGDAIALRSPANRWLLVDAGLAGRTYDAGERRVVPYLTRRGVRRLEALVISHPDADHMGGAGAVRDALRPRWMGGPGVVAGKGMYLTLLRESLEQGVPWVAVHRGMELDLDGMRVEFLFPDRPGLALEDANDGSAVMRVEYGEFSALLTGDAPAQVEEALVGTFGRRLDVDVLKLGHHGSNTSTTAALLEATGATAAVVSVGRGNRYGHPHRDVLARLRQQGVALYRTDRHGSVVVQGSAGGAVRVRTERPPRTQGGMRQP